MGGEFIRTAMAHQLGSGVIQTVLKLSVADGNNYYGSRPPLLKFSGYVEVDAHYIFHPSTMWVRPHFTELGPKNPPKKPILP